MKPITDTSTHFVALVKNYTALGQQLHTDTSHFYRSVLRLQKLFLPVKTVFCNGAHNFFLLTTVIEKSSFYSRL